MPHKMVSVVFPFSFYWVLLVVSFSDESLTLLRLDFNLLALVLFVLDVLCVQKYSTEVF